MVQNFENHYLEPRYQIQKDEANIKLEAKFLDQNETNFQINYVSFFLDNHPTKTEYEKNKNKTHYELGDLKLIVSKPLPSHIKYVQQDDSSFKIIEAKKWDFDKNNIDMEINLPESLDVKDKVLTMVVYAKKPGNINDENRKGDDSDTSIPLTSHTFFNY
jgi:hypothetical protein